jgi:hypothetical protein
MKKPLIILLASVALGVLILAPHGTQAQPAPAGDAFDVLHSGTTGPDGKPGPITIQHITKQTVSPGSAPPIAKPAADPAPVAPPRPPKLHPTLEQWVAEAEQGTGAHNLQDRVEVLVALPDTAKFSKLPELPDGETEETAANTAAGHKRQQIIDGIRAQRKQQQEPLVKKFTHQNDLKLLEQYWLVNGFLADVPLSAVRALAADPAVLGVQPRATGERLPVGNGTTKDDPATARKRIASDPWRTLPYASTGRIGLLDSGVRSDHTLLASPSHLGVLRDCTGNSTQDCRAGTVQVCDNASDKPPCHLEPDPNWKPTDCVSNGGHGTASAAILTGNSNLGNAYQGVTAATVDSWKITPDCQNVPDYSAVVRAFQAAVSYGDKVIVAEIQASDPYGTIEAAADNAFDLGAVVLAANGNFGPNADTVTSPARAHKVLGVGAFSIQDDTTIDNNPPGEGIQSRGPTADGRVKPDLQGPTCTETAMNTSTTALWSTLGFCGTSGSTPYAGGAAALVRSDFAGSYNATDPGWTYAALLAAAEHDTVIPFGSQPDWDNQYGAGQLKLPSACRTWYYYATSITNGQIANLPLYFGGGSIGVKAAIWWPEKASEAHDDIDLFLLDPSGNWAGGSGTRGGVFEKVETLGTVTPGTWTLQVYGYDVKSGPQPVYVYAYAPC